MSTKTGRRAARMQGTTALLVAAGMVLAALLVVWLSAHRTPTAPTAATTSAPSSTAAGSTPEAGSPTAATDAIDAPLPGALTFESLLTPEDLAAIGLPVDSALALDAPRFPVSCSASTWGETWSNPAQSVGHDYPGTGAGISEFALDYDSAPDAGAALDQLVTDAAACADTPGQVTTTATDAGLGEDSAVFRSDDGGRDGKLAVTWAVVTRSGDTLLLSTYTTQTSIGTGSGPGDGGDDSTGDSPQAEATARAIAQAALERLAGS